METRNDSPWDGRVAEKELQINRLRSEVEQLRRDRDEYKGWRNEKDRESWESDVVSQDS